MYTIFRKGQLPSCSEEHRFVTELHNIIGFFKPNFIHLKPISVALQTTEHNLSHNFLVFCTGGVF